MARLSRLLFRSTRALSSPGVRGAASAPGCTLPMGPRQLSDSIRIPGLNCGDNCAVFLGRSVGAAAQTQSGHPGPVRLVQDCVRHACQPAIATTIKKRAMECVIGRGPGIQVVSGECRIHFSMGAFDRCRCGLPLFRWQFRQQSSGGGLKRDDHLIDLAHVFRRQRHDQDAAFRQHAYQPLSCSRTSASCTGVLLMPSRKAISCSER